MPRCARTAASIRPYASRNRPNPASRQRLKRAEKSGPWWSRSSFSIRILASVGTSVRDNRYDASIEITTPSASGVKRKRAGPSSSTTGKNTTQMVSVAAKAGTAICRAPSRIATVSGFPMCRLRWMFSTSTVASSTSMPIASASPPSVMRFKVWPLRNSPTRPTRMARGMLVPTSTAPRQLPRKKRIISETRIDAITASCSTFVIAARTNTDWSKSIFSSIPSGAAALMMGSCSRALSTTASVLASAFFRIARYVARRPSTLTMFACTAYPSRTFATSPSTTVAPSTALTGRSLNACTESGLELSFTSYSVVPICAEPAGTRTLLASTACTTSFGARPFAATRAGSMSTMIWRDLPPNGAGVARPGMVNSRSRMKLSP